MHIVRHSELWGMEKQNALAQWRRRFRICAFRVANRTFQPMKGDNDRREARRSEYRSVSVIR